MPRPLSVIAAEIRRDWKKVNYAAVPYLDAMASLADVDEAYGADRARDVVACFLSNAGTWRGEVARHIKKELNGMLKPRHWKH